MGEAAIPYTVFEACNGFCLASTSGFQGNKEFSMSEEAFFVR